MRHTSSGVRKAVIAFSAVAALAAGGVAAPQLVSAAGEGTPAGRSVVDRADDHVREFQGHHRSAEAGDRAERQDSGFDTPHDRAERRDPNGRHIEPGDDHGNNVEPGDDHGNHVEPGDDHGGSSSGGDDSGSSSGGDDSGSGSGSGGDDSGHDGSDD